MFGLSGGDYQQRRKQNTSCESSDASCSILGLGVDCPTLEINPHERLLPDDPGVMSRGDYPNVSRPELDFGAVTHSDTHTP